MYGKKQKLANLTKVARNLYIIGSKVPKNLRFEARQLLGNLLCFRKSEAQGVENGVAYKKNVYHWNYFTE